MARAQNPDSGDSQFFICFADAPFLNGQYTVWGQVTEGMDNVDKIKRGEPVQNPDRIVSAKMAADATVDSALGSFEVRISRYRCELRPATHAVLD